MPYGYNGKTLRGNLTDETIRTEEPPENCARAQRVVKILAGASSRFWRSAPYYIREFQAIIA